MHVVKLYLLFNPPQLFVSHTLETLDHYRMYSNCNDLIILQ